MEPLRRPTPLTVLATLMAALFTTACSPERWTAKADAEVNPLVEQRAAQVLGSREAQVHRPEPLGEETAAPSAATADNAAPLRLDLSASLLAAVTTGRDFLSEKEGMYLDGLGLTLTRYNFGPLFDGTVSYLYGNGEHTVSSAMYDVDFGFSKILPTGGDVRASLGAGTTRIAGFHGNVEPVGSPPTPDDGEFYDADFSVTFSQPLLRGAGYEVSHEALTQAENDLVYSIRSFELFREDTSIDTAQDYFDLVRQKKQLVNLHRDFEQAVFDREKAEALRQVDRNDDRDVFLAQRREVNAENTLLNAVTRYERSVDDFKISLGLSIETRVEIVDAEPEFVPVRIDADSAVEVALHNRLDLQTQRDRLEDTERALRISRNGLRPDLDFAASYSTSGSSTVDLGGAATAAGDTGNWSAALVLELPLQRKSERNAYRTAQIGLDRARRSLDAFEDGIERTVRDQLRQLEQTETQMELQVLQIGQEERAVAVTEFRWEAGEIESRDLLDARQSLIDAQNGLIDFKTQHFIDRLRLLRNLGLLFIDDNGMWRT